MTSFAADISAFCKETKLSGATVMRKLGLEAYRGILLRSPVDTGRFRASHRISLNRIDTTVEPERTLGAKFTIGAEPGGSELAQALSTLGSCTWGDTIHITNNLPYAKKLEDGHSKQNNHQVDGIYGATFAELSANLQRAIEAAKRGT